MPQPSLSTYHPSLGEGLQQGFAGLLGKVGVSPQYARHVSERALGFLNDLTPVGNATMAADAGTAIRNGHPLQGLGMGALAVLPGVASKAAKGGMFGARRVIKAYHGGKPHGGDFRLGMAGTGAGSPEERAVWFTPNPEDANHYAAVVNADNPQIGPWPGYGTFEGATVYPSNIDAGDFMRVKPQRNPRNREGAQFYNEEFFQNILKKAHRQGRPGVIFESVKEGTLPAADQIAVLRPSRIGSPF